MADQIAIRIPKTNWQEGSAFTASVDFRTRSTGAASTPTTIHYRLDCVTTQRELLAWTSVSAASSVSLAITGAQNAIQSDCNDYEWKQLTVKVDDGLSTQHVDVKKWRIGNLYGSP